VRHLPTVIASQPQSYHAHGSKNLTIFYHKQNLASLYNAAKTLHYKIFPLFSRQPQVCQYGQFIFSVSLQSISFIYNQAMSKIVTVKGGKSEVLRTKCSPVKKEEFGSERILSIMKDMSEALEQEKFGVAIAAPQIGEVLQLFLISAKTIAYAHGEEFDPKTHKNLFVFNPILLKHSKKTISSDEGCLSVPFKYSHSVPRFEKISMQYLDEKGQKKTINASGFLARVLQHEYDHLQGILYIDKAHEIIDVDENLKPV